MNIAANSTPDTKRHKKTAPRQAPGHRDPDPDKSGEQPGRQPRRSRNDERERHALDDASSPRRKPH